MISQRSIYKKINVEKWRPTLIIFILFSFTDIKNNLCDKNKDVDQLLQKAISLNNDGQSKEAIAVYKKTGLLAQSIGCEKGELEAARGIMMIYYQKYDYENALKISDKVKTLAISQKDYTTLTIVSRTVAIFYENLGLIDESAKSYDAGLKYALKIYDSDIRHYQMSLTYYNLAPFYQNRDDAKVLYYLEKSEDEIRKVRANSKTITMAKKLDMLVSVNMNLGIYYKDSKNKNKNIKRSEYYFLEAQKQYNNIDKKDEILETKIDLYQALQEFYQSQKNYGKAIEYGEAMLTMEKSSSMPYNRRVAYMVLAKSYMGQNDNIASQKYLDLYSKLNDSIVSIEKRAVELPIKKIISENKSNTDYKIVIVTVVFFVVIMIIGILLFLYRKRSQRIFNEKYNELIGKLRVEKKYSETRSYISITDETAKNLLQKLERFEVTEKFLKKDVNLTWMANKLNTNTKYLSEIIKVHREKSFTDYINGLRINYIIHKLYNEPQYREYKISYLAEECGYASSQVFVQAFKKINEVTPSYFIEKLKKK